MQGTDTTITVSEINSYDWIAVLWHELNLFGYSDADWAGDLDSRRSTTGYVVYAAGGPIAWQSKLQTTVACSIDNGG